MSLSWDTINETIITICGKGQYLRPALETAAAASGGNAALAAKIKKADLEAEVDRLADWLKELLESEPMPAKINGLFFGLFDTMGPDGPSCELYMCGSSHFDEDDADFDWAANPAYFPEGRYSQTTLLGELNNAANELDDSLGQLISAAFAAGAAREICDRIGPAALLAAPKGKQRKQLPIAIGHDSGGGWLVGTLTPDGWAE